jgi:hypothetical protein
MADLEKLLAATLTGMTVDQFQVEAKKWLATAKDALEAPYTDLTFKPMQEVLHTCATTATRRTSSPVAVRTSCVVCRTDIRNSARADRGLRRRNELWVRQRVSRF